VESGGASLPSLVRRGEKGLALSSLYLVKQPRSVVLGVLSPFFFYKEGEQPQPASLALSKPRRSCAAKDENLKFELPLKVFMSLEGQQNILEGNSST
jgi:hypothetical protein